MELKLDKTTKIPICAIALGLFLNASNVFIDKAYAMDKVHKIAICDEFAIRCAFVGGEYGALSIVNSGL